MQYPHLYPPAPQQAGSVLVVGGGVMARIDKTFPTNDCSRCILAPKLVEAGRDANIDILPAPRLLPSAVSRAISRPSSASPPRYIDENTESQPNISSPPAMNDICYLGIVYSHANQCLGEKNAHLET